MAHEEFVQSDEMIERGRISRVVVLGLFVLTITPFLHLFFVQLVLWFKLPVLLGQLVGASVGVGLTTWIISRSYINNDAFVAFITVDPIIAILKLGSPYISYGPGFHFCFPWEQRSALNVVNLSEVTEKIKTEVQGKGGSFHINGSVRLRPDIRLLSHYRAGAGAVVGDVTDLIITNIAQTLHDKEVQEGLGWLTQLNKDLLEYFKHSVVQAKEVTEFEERFGVVIGDVTIATIKPSAEVQKAIDGVAEDAALELISARNLGFETAKEMYAAKKKGDITTEDISNARKMAMVMTNNLHGMNVSEQNFNLRITGDAEFADALKAAAVAAPAILPHLGKKSGEKPSPNVSKGKT